MNQNYIRLKNIMASGDGTISRKEALRNNVPPATFARFVHTNNLVKLGQGIYAKPECTFDELFLLQRKYPRIVFSGITALSLLGLTDRLYEKIEFTIDKKYRVRKESIGGNTICHIENNTELFNYANTNVKTQFGNTVKCFSKEKIIVEMIRKRDDYDSELFLKALKTFFHKKDKNMDLLLMYARKRKIEEKVYRVLELLDYEN